MINTLKKIFCHKRTQPNSYYSSYYDTVVEKYGSVNDVLKNITINISNAYSTDELIKFKGKIDFGTTEKTTIAKLGVPLYQFENQNISKHSVFVYKAYLGSFKTNIELHFCQKIFFMGVFTFSHMDDKNDLIKIANILKDKYGIRGGDSTNVDICVVDKNNNCIIIDSKRPYSIKYFSGNETFFKNFEQELEAIALKNKTREAKLNSHLMNNL